MIKIALAVLIVVLAAFLWLNVQEAGITGRVTAILNQPVEPQVDFEYPKGDKDVICGGLLYSNLPGNVRCERDILVQENMGRGSSLKCASNCEFENYICLEPGLCEFSRGQKINVKIDLPKFLKLGEELEGKILISGDKPKNIEAYDAEITILEEKQIENGTEISFKIKPTDVSDTLDSYGLERGSISLEFGPENYVSWSFYVYDEKATKCGEEFWNHPGLCIDDVFYPGANCVAGEGCIDFIHLGIPERDVEPFGQKQALIVTVNLKEEQKQTEDFYLDLGKQVSDWYKKESNQLTGKQLLDLQFTFGGHKNLVYKDEEDLKARLEKEYGKFDFLIVALPDLEDTGYEGWVGGFYLYNGFTTLDANNLDAKVLAHELLHGFGARDIYDRQGLCNSRWNNHLLCTDNWISGELISIQQDNSLENKHLGAAAVEIGWIEPQQFPVKKIEFSDIQVIKNTEYTLEAGGYYYFIYPDDVLVTGKVLSGEYPVVANVTVLVDGFEIPCAVGDGKFYCMTGKTDKQIKIKAKLGNLGIEKII